MSRIAVFTSDKVGFCVTRDKVTHTKLYDGNINEAVKAFAKDVPPDSVCATYVQRGDHCELPTLRKLLPTLKAAGYKNIHVYRALCSNTSIALYVANLKCKVENSVAVFHVFSAQRIARGGVDEHSDGVFVGKVPNGYELLLVSDEISDSMELFDNLKHIVIVADDASAKADIRAKYDKELKKDDVTVHVISFDADDYVCAFLWNKYDNGNFNGNLVADSASTMFSFEYEEQKLTLYAEYQLLPYSKVFQIDIFDAESLKVEASFTPDDTTCINSVSFDPSKRRIIQATVSIGLDHLPNVKLATIECEVPGLTKAIRPAGKTSKATALLILLSSTRPQLTVIHSRVEDTREFTSVTELMAYIRRRHPPSTVELFLQVYHSDYDLRQRRECHLMLQKAGYTNLLARDGQVHTWSMSLHRYKVNVDDGDTVAILFNNVYGIVSKQGRKFRIMHMASTDNQEMSIDYHLDNYEVDTILADPTLQDEFDVTELGDRYVIIEDVTHENKTNFLLHIWNLADGLDFDGYFIEQTLFVVFNVCFNGKSRTFETGFVPIPYEWTVELDVEDASSIQVNAKLFYLETVETKMTEINSFDTAKLGSDKVAITFFINSAYHVAARCVALPLGRSPRPISLCLWIERTANGFQKTIYFRDSGKTVVDKCPSLFVAFETFKQAEFAALFFNVFDTTVAEREDRRETADVYGFKTIQFVNGPVLALNSILCDVDPVEFGENTTVMVGDMTAIDKGGQKAPMTYVLQSRHKKLKLQKIVTAKVDKVYSTLDLVDCVFVATDDASKPLKLPEHLNSVVLKTSNTSVSKYLFSRVDGQSDAKPIVDDIAGITFVAEWMDGKQVFDVQFETVPFSRDVALHVGPVKTLKIDTTHYNSKKRKFLKDVSFHTQCDRVVLLKLAVDSIMVPSVRVIRSDPLPSTVFEFTSDNRIVVHRDGLEGLEYPAYVSFDDSILVGESALHRLKTHPETVAYDVHRFFAPDFDPTVPDPAWPFKTSLGKNNETTVHIGESTTTSTVCFGAVVSAVNRDAKSPGGNQFGGYPRGFPRGYAGDIPRHQLLGFFGP